MINLNTIKLSELNIKHKLNEELVKEFFKMDFILNFKRDNTCKNTLIIVKYLKIKDGKRIEKNEGDIILKTTVYDKEFENKTFLEYLTAHYRIISDLYLALIHRVDYRLKLDFFADYKVFDDLNYLFGNKRNSIKIFDSQTKIDDIRNREQYLIDFSDFDYKKLIENEE